MLLEEEKEQLEFLQLDISPYKNVFRQAQLTIKEEGVSNYPVIIAIDKDMGIQLGITLGGTKHFNYSASTLEELVTKKVVNMDRIDEFRKIYKSKNNELCLFCIRQSQSRFLFIP